MKSTYDSYFSLRTGLVSLFIACCVLLGWYSHNPALQGSIGGFPPMIPMTAFNLLLLSMNLILCWRVSQTLSMKSVLRSRLEIISKILCGINFFIACCTIAEHLFHFELGFNALFFMNEIKKTPGLIFNGNMSIQTSMICLFLSSGLFAQWHRRKISSFIIFQMGPLASLFVCLMALSGYLNRISAQNSSKWIGLSAPTILAFMCLSVGLLNLEREIGFMARLRNRRAEGLFLRWYISFSIAAPMLITMAISWGEDRHLYPPAFSDSLFVVIMISALLIMGHFMARAISDIEDQRVASEQMHAKKILTMSEENLQQTKERLEIALSAAKMGIWENNLVDGSNFWSESVQEMLGLIHDGEISHADLVKSVYPADLPALEEAQARAISRREDFSHDFRVKQKDGSFRWLRCTGRVKYDAAGKPLLVNGTTQDITKEKLQQQQTEQALQDAESASRLKSTFLANMSHEIRTPLSAILGFTELLKDPSLSEGDRHGFLDVIERNGKTLAQLLNDILDLSKVESGYLHTENLLFPVREAVNEVVSSLQVRAASKGIFLKTDFTSGTPDRINSDPLRLKQVLMNLVGNAIKFTSKGGVVLRVYGEGAQVFFEISDTGIGIEEHQKAKLFQTFSQADGSMSRKFGGTGLGLLLSKKLALLLGGDVQLLSSLPGYGSCFLAFITDESQHRAGLSPEKIPAAAVEEKPDAYALENIKILVAEDTPDNQTLISTLLRQNGALVTIANNGEECVDQALSRDFDAILMDIQMPVMDGYEATKTLRTHGFVKPIIALSAHAMNEVTEKCREAGCNAHLTKPIHREELVRTLKSLVH